MGKTILVILPLLGVSHLLPSLEFAERLLNQRHDLAIKVLPLRLPVNDTNITSVMEAHPRLSFVSLPMPDLPSAGAQVGSLEKFMCYCIGLYGNCVRNALSEIKELATSEGARVGGLVLDYFCLPMISVANDLSLSSYLFLTSCAGFLRFMQWLPGWDDQGGTFFTFSDQKYHIPGFQNPVPVNALPSPCFNNQGGYDSVLSLARIFNDVKGIIVNTFADLEGYALKEISGKGETPPVYAVGPMINFKGHVRSEMEESKAREAMAWLDEQPDSSVVFICFGTAGAFPSCQVREIAEGIERSNRKFLWHLQVPRGETGTTAEDLLPSGFVERVKGRGMVCGWVRQVELLAHKAIGGFVSHCGWNSTLESVWHGVPLATMPIFAEQRLTAFEIVRELGIAVELKIEDAAEECFATAEEVELAIGNLMDEHSEARKRLKQMSMAARSAVKEGGSSYSSLSRFAHDLCEC